MWRARNPDTCCSLDNNKLDELRHAILKKKGSPTTKLCVVNQPHIFTNQSTSTAYKTTKEHLSSKPEIYETQAEAQQEVTEEITLESIHETLLNEIMNR